MTKRADGNWAEKMSLSEQQITPTPIEGLWLIETKTIADDRGKVREFFRDSTFAERYLRLGPWQQVNVTETQPGAIRGMHGEFMTKLIGLITGEALGAYVDLRTGSPTFGRVVTVPLRLGTQVLVPPGVGNGFQSTGVDPTQYLYCFDREWTPTMDGVYVHPLDPQLAIPWPIEIDPEDRSLLSAKDAALPRLAEIRVRLGANDHQASSR